VVGSFPWDLNGAPHGHSSTNLAKKTQERVYLGEKKLSSAPGLRAELQEKRMSDTFRRTLLMGETN